ncbi:MAG TPA: hypothetical protein VNB06_08505, partial [Thermoanaerobaculia bacterium]|nr:hypothetical protein [Thermoanaerobaculia bacterium]
GGSQMFRVRMIQARFGDCLLLEYGSPATPRFLLVDGGPSDTFEDHLRAELEVVAGDGHRLDLAMLSHVDKDHVVGLLDLLARLRADDATDPSGASRLIGIDGLWHNSFARSIDVDGALAPRLRAATTNAASVLAMEAIQGVAEGHALRLAAQTLALPINGGFPDDLICVDDAPGALVLDNLSLSVVGPTRANLDKLHDEWETWLDAHEEAVASGDPAVLANSDQSIPNLSSIMVLAEADQKKLLLTGDGRSDHLLKGLEQAGLLDATGRFHVDALKVPHHGSDRNATRTFFRKVTADRYLISANGRDDNPDFATLTWIVEEAAKVGRQIEILVTNETPSTQRLLDAFDPGENGYTLTLLPPGESSLTVVLAA